MAGKANNNELLQDEDFSSEDIEVYRPNNSAKEDLQVEEEAYKLLEYIEVEWPSLSIDNAESKIIIATCPETEKCKPELLSIEIQNTNFEKLQFQSLPIEHSPNKLRVHGKHVFTLSDTHLIRYSLNDKFKNVIKGEYGFGLCVTDEHVFAGTTNGYVEIYTHDLKLISKFKASDKSIECVGFTNAHIFTGSTDYTLKQFTLKGESVYSYTNDSDINALEGKGDIVIFGDDIGKLHKLNLTTKSIEILDWHKSAISFVRWKDEDIFVTGSEEQVCIWDLSLQDNEKSDETESIYPTSLLFVHQGQRNYKDCCFNENMVITTSEDGICVFEPVSFFPL